MGRILRYTQTVNAAGYHWVEDNEEAPGSSSEEYDRLEAQGYEVIRREPQSPRHVFLLTDGVTFMTATDAEYFVFNALAKPRLFREFAALGQYCTDCELQKEKIRAFANKYGFLGVKPRMLGGPKYQGAEAERLEDWRSAISDMYLAVELWDLLRAKNNAALSDRISFEDDKDAITYRSAGLVVNALGGKLYVKRELIAASDPAARRQLREAWDSINNFNRQQAAKWLLQRWVNKALKENMSARLLWTGKPGEGVFELHFEPTSLLSAMWCQLAREIADNESERVCEHCGKPILDSARADKRHCDNRCRAWHSRRQKRDAQES